MLQQVKVLGVRGFQVLGGLVSGLMVEGVYGFEVSSGFKVWGEDSMVSRAWGAGFRKP